MPKLRVIHSLVFLLGNVLQIARSGCESQTCSLNGLCSANPAGPLFYCLCINYGWNTYKNICMPCPIGTLFNPTTLRCDVFL